MKTKEAIKFLREIRASFNLLLGRNIIPSDDLRNDIRDILPQVIKLLKRGEKYEAMWREMYKNWGEYPIELHDIAEFMDDIEQKYFPREEKK